MAIIRAELRIETDTKEDAEAARTHFHDTFGLDIALKAPRHGRGGAWFVYGVLVFDPAAPKPQLTEVMIPATGEIVQARIKAPALPPPDALAAQRQARLRRAGAVAPRPDDGVDRHALHKALRAQQGAQQEAPGTYAAGNDAGDVFGEDDDDDV